VPSPIADTPELTTSQWLNTPQPLSLARLRGKVVLVHAFQMLCPGCVAHALPQAAAVHRAFGGHDVVVIGLHSVFEHHEVMGVEALKAFVHEYRIDYPVAVDQPADDGPIPCTMRDFGLRGTPSLLLFDRQGRLRVHEFGRVHDLVLGVHLGGLLSEEAAGAPARSAAAAADGDAAACGGEVCQAPPAAGAR
jgi:thiol-disulfide isomerase/thioredoxin